MKKLAYKLPDLLMTLVIIFSAFSVSIAQKAKSIKGNTTLELAGYSVVSPSGDDWKYFIIPDRNTVQFMYESSNFLNGKENSTFVVVFKDSLLSEIDKSEREYADEFLKENLNGFKSQEHMNVKRSKNFDTTIAGRNFYAMSSSADDLGIAIPCTYADNLFFIHFPDDFKTTKTFYQFVITGYYNLPLGKKNSNESDLKPVFSIMRSFRTEKKALPDKK